MSWCFYIDNYWIVLDIWIVDYKIKYVVVKDFFGNIKYIVIIILKKFFKIYFFNYIFKFKIVVFFCFFKFVFNFEYCILFIEYIDLCWIKKIFLRVLRN